MKLVNILSSVSRPSDPINSVGAFREDGNQPQTSICAENLLQIFFPSDIISTDLKCPSIINSDLKFFSCCSVLQTQNEVKLKNYTIYYCSNNCQNKEQNSQNVMRHKNFPLNPYQNINLDKHLQPISQ